MGSRTPLQAMKDWHILKPDLFKKQPYHLPGCDRYLRANKLAFTVFDSYDDIVTACCSAWNFFATDPKAIASITSRTWAEVK